MLNIKFFGFFFKKYQISNNIKFNNEFAFIISNLYFRINFVVFYFFNIKFLFKISNLGGVIL